jgi:hypothetical protein
MKTFRGLLLVLAPLFLLCVTNAQNEESGAGAVILAEVVPPVVFRDGDEGGVEKKMIPGMLLPEGYWVETGQGGNVLLLLSNGTVVTITENSKMSIDSFDQEPFETEGTLVDDLREEPSSSSVLVDLEVGSLVVQTKKLNKKSNFEISTPLGVAGIRGTEFKMRFDPKAGIQLDVTESTVAFTPRGAGRAMAVRAGRGLSLAPGRIPIARPVFPPVAVEIEAFNGRARRSVGKTPVTFVKRSMSEASRSRFLKKRNRRAPSRSRDENRGNETPADLPDSEPNDPLPPAPPPADPFTPRTPLSADPGSIFFPGQVKRPEEILEFLENNMDVTQARKTGRVGKRTRELAKLVLSVGETNRFYEFNEEIQANLLKESAATGKRLLGIDSIGPAEVDKFFRYSPEARSKMLGLPDGAFANLLKQGVDENLLMGALGGESIAASQSGKLPAAPPENSLTTRAMALAERFKDTSQSYVLEELLAAGGGVLDEAALRKGEVADLLLRDYRLGSTGATGLTSFDSSEVLGNPFYLEISSLYASLENDQLVAGSVKVLGGANLIVEANSQALSPYFAGAAGKTVVLSAAGSLTFKGDFSWASKPQDAARLVVMSTGETKFANGVTLKSATGDLVLSSRADMNLNGVELDVAREAVIRGMRDVSLVNTRIGADSMATVKAVRNLNVDGLSFSRGVSSILMEATTIRLSNLNFPASSMVRLNSLKGPIDGRYPNFGTAVPMADQIGRVNFLKNVSSGGNALLNRQTFDQFGRNISIGKIPKP